jgi:hypothetical protein
VSTFILSVYLRNSPGSKIRERALDIAMRNGEEFEFNSQAFELFRWNLRRHFIEAVSLNSIAYCLLTGFTLIAILKLCNTELCLSSSRFGWAFVIFLLLSALAMIGNVLGSLIAYLQTWHYSSFVIFLSVAFFSLGGWSALKVIELFRRYSNFQDLLVLISFIFIVILQSIIFDRVIQFEQLSSQRYVLFESRSSADSRGDAISIPLVALDGRELTEDIDSDWVAACFVKITDSGLNV